MLCYKEGLAVSSFDSTVISGVPQGTVLGSLIFIILMCDIKSGITSYSMDCMVSFADGQDYTILTLVTLGCLAASNCQPDHHGVSTISNNLHGPGCC